VPIELKINGQAQKLSVEPRMTLLDTLRDRLDMTGAKKVCDRGTCGACSVIVDGQLRYSCMTLAVECVGSQIETIEGIAPAGEASPVSKAFAECDALQCGFCTPGFVMAITHHLRNEAHPTLETVKQACRGNLCRCGTYNRVFEAALLAATRGAGLQKGTPAGGKKEGK
jgi:aerobic-type carbon monoxide dehydrogenase small subunit (CoxS/CutS family)